MLNMKELVGGAHFGFSGQKFLFVRLIGGGEAGLTLCSAVRIIKYMER